MTVFVATLGYNAIMPIVAQTERLCLRSWTDVDRDPYARYCNVPRVMKYLGGVQDAEDLEADVAWFIECQRVYGHTLWVVERKGDGAFLGFAGLDKLLVVNGEVPSTLHGEVEVGWRLRADAWGSVGVSVKGTTTIEQNSANRHSRNGIDLSILYQSAENFDSCFKVTFGLHLLERRQ